MNRGASIEYYKMETRTKNLYLVKRCGNVAKKISMNKKLSFHIKMWADK